MKDLIELLRYVVTHPLNKQQPSAAVLRVLKWQIGARLLPDGAVLPFVGNTHLLVKRGMAGATGNWYCGLHEVEEMAFVLHALSPGELFVDVGSNIGSYSILAAGAAGAEVVAVEPVPSTFEALKQNVRLNLLDDRVKCLNVGLGYDTGELRFSSGEDTTNHVLVDGEKKASVVVPVITLDAVCAERLPAIIKVDVEGFEHAVVEGGRDVLADAAVKAVIMETNSSGQRYGWRDEDLIALMRDFGFATCSYEPMRRRLEVAKTGSENTVFVRNVAEMQSRISKAPRFQLVNGTI